MAALTDLSPMPFGKHLDTPMQDVPARYLYYLWDDSMRDEKPGTSDVGDYIRDNLNALEEEYDAEW